MCFVAVCGAANAFDSPLLVLMCGASLLRQAPASLLRSWSVCLRAYVLMFPTHTEGGDPDSLHEKKIKGKDFKSELSNTLSLGMLFT